MASRGATYPQVDVRAVGLATPRVVTAPAETPVAPALRLLQRARGLCLAAPLGVPGGAWGAATRDTLERAQALGLHAVPVRALLWRAPWVDPWTPEIVTRRRLSPARPILLVRSRRGPPGAVLLDERGSLPRSLGPELARLPAFPRDVLRRAGALGHARGWPVAAVGGLVRDLVMRRPVSGRVDLDLVVDGEARALAEALARDLGGVVQETLRTHAAFLTATLVAADGRRIDVATARRERYRVPGALPEVEPASLADDLWRRDFSVNALAVRLDGKAWGAMVDPTGGLADARRRRLRALHPLSFVEDPTRIFRAGRLAARLRARLESSTRRLVREALGLGRPSALSGERLWREFVRIREEPRPPSALLALGRLGAFRLCAPGYRFGRAEALGLARVAHRAAGLSLAAETHLALDLLVLTARLGRPVRETWLASLGVPAPIRRAFEAARREGPEVAARLEVAGGSEVAFRALRGRPETVVAWAAVLVQRRAAREHARRHLAGWRALPSLLTGEDLIARGWRPGPALGRTLARVREAQVAGRVGSREEALAWAQTAPDASPSE